MFSSLYILLQMFVTFYMPISLVLVADGWRRRYYSARCYFGRVYDRRCRVGDLRGSAVTLRCVVSQRQCPHQRTQQPLEDATKSQGK